MRTRVTPDRIANSQHGICLHPNAFELLSEPSCQLRAGFLESRENAKPTIAMGLCITYLQLKIVVRAALLTVHARA